ncbi:hypothetical protein [Zobellia galactanivorans]|uniref:hypothetical protein n=1 Tax=Zobellia galactanivorans (strain DSM 12802 / CCUG 47099 / CIP 106680 / NCIMB 13871 / Dsij) TaxID=63186 RepID=UPI001C07B8F8|nr:hypothetical protein [Zobellia galactanivorans]MBU3025911.1 hypothetical protein [Zobellia galactanivorans]
MKKRKDHKNLSQPEKKSKPIKIQFCTCYSEDVTHPDYAFCKQCRKPVKDTDDDVSPGLAIIKALIGLN